MRTKIEKEYLKELYMDENTEGKLIDDLFIMPRYLAWKKRREQEGGQRIMSQDFNEAVNNGNNQGEISAPKGMPANNPVSVPAHTDMQNPETIEKPKVEASSGGFGALDDAGEIERKKFDPTQYIGKDSLIEYIEERQGKFGYYIILYSQPVDEGEMEIRATLILGLEEDENGKLGWPKESPMYNFLKKYNVSHYKDLIGNPVMIPMKDKNGKDIRRISGYPKTAVKIQTNKAKDGNEYLTF